MSNDLQFVQEIGIKDEATFGTDPITDGAETFYEFGLFQRSFGEFPILTSELIKSYTGKSYDPSSINVGSTSVMGSVASATVHGLGLYRSLCRTESGGAAEDGGVVDDGSNQYTITPITDGEKQSYTTRWHSKNTDAADIQKSVVGCRTQQYTMSLDLTQKKLPLAQTETFQGQLMQDVVANTGDYTLQQPDALSKLFYWDNSANSVFTWDGDDFSNELLNLSFTVDSLDRLGKISGQHYPRDNVTGDRIMVVGLKLERRNSTAIFDDYMGQAGTSAVPNDTFKDIVFKIANVNSKFIQLTLSDIGITSFKLNHAFREGQQIPTYELTGTVSTVAPVIKDGITTLSHYGISA
ncbi:hypothetical protein KAR91_79985 [Candidatus Pacearchaeota archaeon]|nr:hypothetical protein [Candidatus Pacearchaeota archaeon]